jgi:CRISPR/Cas system-associated endoribonuclease Cas2
MQEHEAVRWLQLTYKVPSEPSQKRVWVWRRLQNMGAYALQNSVYLLPFSEEVEKRFRQLAQQIREMGGDASVFAVVPLDPSDEQRIRQTLLEARHNEYGAVIVHCASFFARASHLIDAQDWTEQVSAELAEALEKIHTLFRTARRHDLLGALTATSRATAAETMAACEQLFRVLFDKDYAKARRLLDQYRELYQDADASIDARGSDTPLSNELEEGQESLD